MKKTVAIIGLGLMGGSIAKALRPNDSIIVRGYCHSNRSYEIAKNKQIVDHLSTNLIETVEGADIVILATPLSSYASLLTESIPHLQPEVILSDVGSVKQPIIDLFRNHYPEFLPRLVPAHPIAGKETSGLEEASATLFQGKKLIITPTELTADDALATIQYLWKSIGAKPEEMEADEHDEIFACCSHLIQSISYQLPQILPNPIPESLHRFSRLTQSPTPMWQDIFIANKTPLHEALQAYIGSLSYLLEKLKSHKYEALLDVYDMAKSMRAPLDTSKQTDDNCWAGLQLLATAMVTIQPDSDYGGSGFKDVTSILCTATPITSDILSKEHEEITDQVEHFIQLLERVDNALITST